MFLELVSDPFGIIIITYVQLNLKRNFEHYKINLYLNFCDLKNLDDNNFIVGQFNF